MPTFDTVPGSSCAWYLPCSVATGRESSLLQRISLVSLTTDYCTMDRPYLSALVERYSQNLKTLIRTKFCDQQVSVPGCSSLVRSLILHGNKTPVRATDTSNPNELDYVQYTHMVSYSSSPPKASRSSLAFVRRAWSAIRCVLVHRVRTVYKSPNLSAIWKCIILLLVASRWWLYLPVSVSTPAHEADAPTSSSRCL